MQELETLGAFLDGMSACSALYKGDRRVFACSYGWLTAEHPDPKGVRIRTLQRFFRGLASRGQLPTNACLFWDFGSLPQKPRTATEQETFKEALDIMTRVYASPLGTCVLQMTEIPECPDELSRSLVVLEDEKSPCTEQGIRACFSQAGVVVSVERTAGAITVRYDRTMDDRVIERALALDTASLGEAKVFAEYNARPYHDRGWCVMEEAISFEAEVRSNAFPEAKEILADVSKCRAKVYVISSLDEPTEPEAHWQNSKTVKERLRAAKFTGKADEEEVPKLYDRQQVELAAAMVALDGMMQEITGKEIAKHGSWAEAAVVRGGLQRGKTYPGGELMNQMQAKGYATSYAGQGLREEERRERRVKAAQATLELENQTMNGARTGARRVQIRD